MRAIAIDKALPCLCARLALPTRIIVLAYAVLTAGCVSSVSDTPPWLDQGTASTSVVTVRKGDTLSAIAKRYATSIRALARRNNLRPPYVIFVGQTLTLPNGSFTHPQTVTAVAKPQPRWRTPTRATILPKTVTAVAKPQPRWRAPTRATILKRPPQRKAKASHRARTVLKSTPVAKFAWPLHGTVIGKFGLRKTGGRNDGINIAVARGTPVKAVASGIVAYAGDRIKSFGNLLLIKHSGGWMTAYAHTDVILVKRGDRVKRGQIIAKAGATGSAASSTPQLHFELRKGTKAVDPLRYLQ